MVDIDSHLTLPDASATEALGVALAHAYAASGGGAAVLHLHGELGAGKTTCARSLLRELGVDGVIRSPTYTLVENYRSPHVACMHVDLYRLSSPLEVDELGLQEALGEGLLMLIEWPERGGAAVPPADLTLMLSYAAGHRSAVFHASTPRGRAWSSMLREDASIAAYVSNLT